jgi:hypothetical protein
MRSNDAGHTASIVNLQRIGLWTVIASVGLAAFLGVSVLLIGESGETQSRVFSVTGLVFAAGLVVLAAAPAVSRKWRRPLPEMAIAAAAGGFGLLSVLIWVGEGPHFLYKLALSLMIWSLAIAHAALLSTARLATAYLWSLVVAYGASIMLAATLSVVVVVNDIDGGTTTGRVVGIMAIAVVGTSIAVPVFHRMSRLLEGELAPAAAADDEPTIGFCPLCGATIQAQQPGKTIDCGSCKVRTVIALADE